jgi:hypothetical protein
MEYTTLKISKSVHKLIKDIALKENIPQNEVLDLSLKEYEKKLFWEKCKNAYEALSVAEDKIDYQSEQELLDGTLMDGLDDEY